jgi:hypothetical protein
MSEKTEDGAKVAAKEKPRRFGIGAEPARGEGQIKRRAKFGRRRLFFAERAASAPRRDAHMIERAAGFGFVKRRRRTRRRRF